MSMGGYLAAGAAAFEHRIAACVLNDGVYDFHDSFAGAAKASAETSRSVLPSPRLTDVRPTEV